MQTERLIAHPAHPPLKVRAVSARITGFYPDWLTMRWRIDGSESLIVPPFAGRRRADGLWRTTCFELFIRPVAGDAYVELNLSPSERWAAYDFAAYRAGMSERPFPRDPVCTIRRGGTTAIFDAAVPVAGLPALPWHCGLSAVIEEDGGTRSYWALRHPEGDPDFHHRDCFALPVPAPEAS